MYVYIYIYTHTYIYIYIRVYIYIYIYTYTIVKHATKPCNVYGHTHTFILGASTVGAGGGDYGRA